MTLPDPLPPRSLTRDVDQLLRGGFTREEDLRGGRVGVPTRTLVLACLLLGLFYGAMMGLYAWSTAGRPLQAFASALKVPLLFLLTLGVTFPSLYVFSALARSRLGAIETLRLLLVAVAVNLAVLASFGPVTAFFTFSTDSYPFMKVLNVAFFGVAGIIGLGFLRRALDPVLGVPESPAVEEPSDEEEDAAPALKRVSGLPPRDASIDPARRVFTVWLVVYGVVGAQMGWILRPFVGSPELPFEWFRRRDSNFLQDILRTLADLFA